MCANCRVLCGKSMSLIPLAAIMLYHLMPVPSLQAECANDKIKPGRSVARRSEYASTRSAKCSAAPCLCNKCSHLDLAQVCRECRQISRQALLVPNVCKHSAEWRNVNGFLCWYWQACLGHQHRQAHSLQAQSSKAMAVLF